MGAWPGWGDWREWRKNTATGTQTARTLNGGTGTGLGTATTVLGNADGKELTRLKPVEKHVGILQHAGNVNKMFVAKT